MESILVILSYTQDLPRNDDLNVKYKMKITKYVMGMFSNIFVPSNRSCKIADCISITAEIIT